MYSLMVLRWNKIDVLDFSIDWNFPTGMSLSWLSCSFIRSFSNASLPCRQFDRWDLDPITQAKTENSHRKKSYFHQETFIKKFSISKCNVCYTEKVTKHCSNTLLCLISFFTTQTLFQCKKWFVYQTTGFKARLLRLT